jgi:cobalamin biosynthesis protein CbiD
MSTLGEDDIVDLIEGSELFTICTLKGKLVGLALGSLKGNASNRTTRETILLGVAAMMLGMAELSEKESLTAQEIDDAVQAILNTDNLQ